MTRSLLAAFAILCLWQPVGAQVGVVIHGRVEDAASRSPIAGARVLSADSASAVFTDSAGAFGILINVGVPFAFHVEQYGYLAQRFDLGPEAPSKISVLLLEPAPFVLEGINVVGEAALTELLNDLKGRRNAYLGAVTVFDRARLIRFGAGGSALDFVRLRLPLLFECNAGLSGLCVPGRRRSFMSTSPEDPVTICVDAWESWGASSELQSLDMQAVALLEIYSRGRGGIRLYTAAYLAASASARRNVAAKPLWWGC